MVNPIIIVILLSISPISELRGAIPTGIALGLDLWTVFLIAVIANILISAVIFLFLDFIHKRLITNSNYRKFFNRYVEHIRTRKNSVQKKINLYGLPALAIFVAIPLPLTGAYTGTLIAWLLNLNRWKAFAAIDLGVVVAGLLVTFVTLGIVSLIF